MDSKKLDTIRDLTKFAPNFFTIKTKSGAPAPFALNDAQLYIHKRLEDQLKETGKVRAVILKGRQQGCSTYIQARYFHKVITTKGKKAYILTHEAEATKNLFEMTKRYYDTLPAGLCPEAERSNARELKFLQFDSGYSVGTAGNKGAGRSQTIQLFHGSEVAYWPNAREHSKGVMEAVSNEPGTEIILESTANGIGNYFHSMWQTGASEDEGYQSIFVPWFWQKEYTAPAHNIQLNDEENELMDFYADSGLTVAHLAWRRGKIRGLSHDYEEGREEFYQEYPMSAEEAFRNPISNVFVNAKHVMRARKNKVESEVGLIIGVDPAIGDKDKSCIIRRRGRLAYGLETMKNHNTMELAGKLKRIIEQENPVRVFIDCIGIGAGVVDRLQELGFQCVTGLNVGRTANDKEHFANLRSELWHDMREWLMQNDMQVQIPDSNQLHGALCTPGFKYRSNGQLLIESKDDIRKRQMPSPDEADALMHTFFSGAYAGDFQVPVIQIPQHERGMFM